MFCINCGTKLPDDAKFCYNCGNKVGEKLSPDEPQVLKDEEKSLKEEKVISLTSTRNKKNRFC